MTRLARWRRRIRRLPKATTTPTWASTCGRCGDQAWIVIGDLALCCGCWTTTPAKVGS